MYSPRIGTRNRLDSSSVRLALARISHPKLPPIVMDSFYQARGGVSFPGFEPGTDAVRHTHNAIEHTTGGNRVCGS